MTSKNISQILHAIYINLSFGKQYLFQKFLNFHNISSYKQIISFDCFPYAFCTYTMNFFIVLGVFNSPPFVIGATEQLFLMDINAYDFMFAF